MSLRSSGLRLLRLLDQESGDEHPIQSNLRATAPRVRPDLPNQINVMLPVQSCLQKYFASRIGRHNFFVALIPPSREAHIAIVTDVGCGMRINRLARCKSPSVAALWNTGAIATDNPEPSDVHTAPSIVIAAVAIKSSAASHFMSTARRAKRGLDVRRGSESKRGCVA